MQSFSAVITCENCNAEELFTFRSFVLILQYICKYNSYGIEFIWYIWSVLSTGIAFDDFRNRLLCVAPHELIATSYRATGNFTELNFFTDVTGEN